MRPLLLSSHERSLTQVLYSKEGDLLFSVSKDHVVVAWWTHNGERLGTYNGHNGTVWTVDVDSTTTYLLTGSADNALKLWRVQTGECIKTWEFATAIKRVQFSEDDTKILVVTEQRMGHPGQIRIFDLKREGEQPDEPSITINAFQSRFTVAAWSYLDRFVVAAHENGTISLFEAETGEEWDARPKVHTDVITDLQMSPDRTYFVTASKDKAAKLVSVDSLDTLKTFQTETPLNSATILPGKPYIILGGGQDAMSVTTTSARQGHFEVRIWHAIFEQELTRVKGGFGPCNTLAAHPDGTGYALGAEDGYVRLHAFDEDFFKARPYGNLDQDLED